MSITFGQGQNIWTLEDGEYHLERGQPGCKLETTTQAIYVDPKRSALLVIDMQNFFLSEKLGRGPKGRELYEPIKKSIQAMRPHGATVIWLNWGISEVRLLFSCTLLMPGSTRDAALCAKVI